VAFLAMTVSAGASLAAGCSAAASSEPTATACQDSRALTCAYFDGTARAWSHDPPTRVSLQTACAPAGTHGELDAFVETPGQYWLDRIGFEASGNAVRTPPIAASDDAGGTTYGCGQGGGKVLTQLLCGKDVGMGTLALRFTFAGRWADGAAWTKECSANVEIVP
jgi:hypothetical protein